MFRVAALCAALVFKGPAGIGHRYEIPFHPVPSPHEAGSACDLVPLILIPNVSYQAKLSESTLNVSPVGAARPRKSEWPLHEYAVFNVSGRRGVALNIPPNWTLTPAFGLHISIEKITVEPVDIGRFFALIRIADDGSNFGFADIGSDLADVNPGTASQFKHLCRSIRLFLGLFGGDLDLAERQADQQDAGAGDKRFDTCDPHHNPGPPSGVLGALSGLMCVLLALGGLVVAVLSFKRGGDALGRAIDGRRRAWVTAILYALLGWGACCCGAGAVVWWLGGGWCSHA